MTGATWLTALQRGGGTTAVVPFDETHRRWARRGPVQREPICPTPPIGRRWCEPECRIPSMGSPANPGGWECSLQGQRGRTAGSRFPIHFDGAGPPRIRQSRLAGRGGIRRDCRLPGGTPASGPAPDAGRTKAAPGGWAVNNADELPRMVAPDERLAPHERRHSSGTVGSLFVRYSGRAKRSGR